MSEEYTTADLLPHESDYEIIKSLKMVIEGLEKEVNRLESKLKIYELGHY